GGALGDVRARDEDDLGAEDVAPGVRAAVDTEGLLVARAGAHHAEAAVVVDVRGAQAHVGELAEEVTLLGRQARAGEHGEGVRAVLLLDALDLRGGPGDGGLIGQLAEAPLGAGRLLVGVHEAVGVRLLQVTLHALRAHHPAVEGELVPGLDADDGVVAHLQLHAALLPAEAAVRLDVALRLDAGVDAQALGVGAVGAEALDGLEVEAG